MNVVTADGNITNMDVMEGKIGYANGQRIVGTKKDEFVVPIGTKFGLSDIIYNNGVGWNIQNTMDLSYMFYNCKSNVTNIDITTWNLQNVRTTYGMFCLCKNLRNINIDWSKFSDEFTTASVMFAHCYNLTNMEIDNLTVKNINIDSMFGSCYNLINLNLDGWTVKGNITGCQAFVGGCNNLSTASIDNIINFLIRCNYQYPDSSMNLNKNAFLGPFYTTNIENTVYQNRWEELTAAGWTY